MRRLDVGEPRRMGDEKLEIVVLRRKLETAGAVGSCSVGEGGDVINFAIDDFESANRRRRGQPWPRLQGGCAG